MAKLLEMLKKRLLVRVILGILFSVSGYILLLWIDWRIALAVFLIHMGINMERRATPWLKYL